MSMFDISSLLPGFNTNWQLVTLTSTPQLLIPPNPRRPILYIANPFSVTLQCSITPVGQGGFNSQFQVAAQTFKQFTWILDGPMSTFGWYLWNSGAGGQAGYLEVLWYPQQIGA